MNVTWVKLRGVVTELRGIRHELARIADCLEADLSEREVPLPSAIPVSTARESDEPGVSYVDEEADYLRELEEAMGKVPDSEEEPSDRLD